MSTILDDLAKMPKQKTWTEKAHLSIGEAYLVFREATGLMPGPSLSESHKKELLRIIDGHYPFGQRAMHPYKMWLKVRRQVIEFLWPKTLPCDIGLFEEGH